MELQKKTHHCQVVLFLLYGVFCYTGFMNNTFERKSPEVEAMERDHDFEQLINSYEQDKSEAGQYIEYNLPYPKELFLKYLTEKKDFLLHGSGEDFDTLEPQQANDAHKESGNKKAVYAVTDTVFPIFYAIKDRGKINGSVTSGRTEKDGTVTYEFGMPKSAIEQNPYKDGVIYILNKSDFTPEYDDGEPSNEWTSAHPVKPWAKLKVTPEDFQYMDKVITLE